MRASSASSEPLARTPRSRAGLALGWVTLFVGILSVGAVAMFMMTSSAQKNIARATVAQSHVDVAMSALAEVTARLRHSSLDEKPYLGVEFAQSLGPAWPPPALSCPPETTRKLIAAVYPGLTVSDVSMTPLQRGPPGVGGEIAGLLELTVRVEGRAGGYTLAREVTQRILFTVDCAVSRTSGTAGSFARSSWGLPTVDSRPNAQTVVNL